MGPLMMVTMCGFRTIGKYLVGAIHDDTSRIQSNSQLCRFSYPLIFHFFLELFSHLLFCLHISQMHVTLYITDRRSSPHNLVADADIMFAFETSFSRYFISSSP